MANLSFDATNVDISNNFDPVPEGEYTVIVTESEVRETKNGAGKYLNLSLEIQGGEFHGRKLWDRLNLWNSNAQAVTIAQRQLAQACHAIGQMHVQDSSELHYKPMTAIVRIRKEEGRSPQNEIRGYKPAATGIASQPPAVQPPRASNAAPWSKQAA